MTTDHPAPQTAPAQKSSIPLFLAGIALALTAVWMAADGAANGLLDFNVKGLRVHLVATDNPLGFWAAEGVILLFGLFFLAAGFAALKPRRSR